MEDQNSSTGFEVYQMYLAMKAHFNQKDYDYNKYNGKVSVKYDTFKRRKDRWHFEKISKKYRGDSFHFLLSNFIENKSFWAGRAMDKKHDEIYNKWMGYVEGKDYMFETDIRTLQEYCESSEKSFDDLFEAKPGKHPIIYKLYKQNHIHYYTLCLMAVITRFHTKVDELNPFDPVWKQESERIEKTLAFCHIDEKMATVVNKYF